MGTLKETQETLRAKPGIDITKLKPGTIVWLETVKGVYKIMPTGEAVGHVMVDSSESPLEACRPVRLILEKSIYDDRGEVFVPFWIGKGLRILFRGFRGSFLTSSVLSAMIEGDGWKYEVWEKDLTG